MGLSGSRVLALSLFAAVVPAASVPASLTGKELMAKVEAVYARVPAVALSSPGTQFQGSTYRLDVLRRARVVATFFRTRDPGARDYRLDLWPGGKHWFLRLEGERCWRRGAGPPTGGGRIFSVDPTLIGKPRATAFGWVLPTRYRAGNATLTTVFAIDRRTFHVRYTDDGPGGLTRTTWRTLTHAPSLPTPTPLC